MIRSLAFMLTVLALAACKARERRPAGPPPTTAVPASTAPAGVRPIEWDEGSPSPRLGDAFLDGRLVVEDVRRQVGDGGFMVACVRLKNMTGEPVHAEGRITYFNRRGRPTGDALIGWKPFVADPYGRIDVTQPCPNSGAIDFQLEVRPPTGDTESESTKEGKTAEGQAPAEPK